MMKRLFYTVLALCVVGTTVGQHRQQLSFEQAVILGKMQNPAIEAAKAAHEAATAKRKATYGLHLPRLDVAANYTIMSQDIGHIDLNPAKEQAMGLIGSLGLPIPPSIVQAINGIDLSYTLQKSQFAMVGATLTVPIFMGGRINAANNAAKIQEHKADLQGELVEEELFVEIAERYWGLLLQRHVSSLLDEVSKGVELHMNNAKQLEANGIIARAETLYAEMAYSQAVASYEKSLLDVATTNSALSGSLSQSALYEPTTELFISNDIPSLDQFKTKVKQNSSQLKQVGLIKKLAEQAVKAERGNFFPQVAAIGGYDIWNFQLSNQLPRWVAGVGVKFNIFDGLEREYKYKAAKAQVRQVEAVEQKANTDIMILVEKLYNSMLAAQEQVKANDTSIAFAEEYLTAKQKAFAEGMATSSDVVDAQLNLAKYKTERLAAMYAFDTTLAKLLALSGEAGNIFSFLAEN